MIHKHPVRLAAILLALLLLLGNGQLQITDPVESNYTLTAWEMLEAGDWLSPRIYGDFWFDKPAFFYWELMAAFKLFGATEFAARFFPVLFALANLALIYLAGKKLYGKETGCLAMLILGTSLEFWYLGKAVITDMAFVFFFNATLLTLYLGFATKQRRLYLLSYALAGLAVLTKGPIGLLLPGLIILVFLIGRKHYSELLHLNWLPGLVLFALFGCSWYYQMYQVHGQAFLDGFLGVHNFLRATVSEHPRDNVWFYYAVIFLAGLCPWSFILLYQLKKRWAELKQESWNEHTVFLLLWALIVNVFFQLMATKYLTYTLPALLPEALLCAHLLEPKHSLVRRTALGTGVVLAVLTFLVAMPLCRQTSGHDVAEYLTAHADGAPVYSYARAYRTSEVYYYRHPIPWLDTAENVQLLRPDGISWNAKNVMPFQTIENLPRGTVFYVICDSKLQDNLLELLADARPEAQAQFSNRVVLRCCLPTNAAP